MKTISDYIFEEKLKYQLPEDYEQKSIHILNELVDSLPSLPGGPYKKRGNIPGGEFWFNKFDVMRYPAESAKYKGNASGIHLYIDTKNNDIGVGVIDSVSKEMVKVDGKGVRADRCCLISRKDGKK